MAFYFAFKMEYIKLNRALENETIILKKPIKKRTHCVIIRTLRAFFSLNKEDLTGFFDLNHSFLMIKSMQKNIGE